MFAPQNQQPTILDSLTGTMEDWYDAVDASIKKSDVIPGNYDYTVATSYGNVDTIQEGSSTHFDVTCDRFRIISLENSYITIEQEVSIHVPDQTGQGNGYAPAITEYYVGYKFAADVIDQYRLYTNSDHLLTQNHANYEWFMIYNSISDVAKENSDMYATLKKIRNKNPFVPGVYVKIPEFTAEKSIMVPIKVRIPLSAFLPLYNLKYYPNWSGKLTIEIYPSYKNLVIAPVVSEETLKSFSNRDIVNANFGFHNINQKMMNYLEKSNGNVISVGPAQTWTCDGSECVANRCKIRLATYLLKIDLFNALAAKYVQVPLIFPIQKIQIKDFTNNLEAKEGSFTTANTICLKHCDAMFTVFKKDVHARTCFENPFIECRFNVDGKFYPREDLRTYDDERFINTVFDALNINNSLVTSIHEDLRTSLQPFYEQQNYGMNGARAKDPTKIWCNKDYSNFMIGIPFCDSDDFMGGISTTGAVQIEMSGKRGYLQTLKWMATTICFEDAFLKIRAMKPDGRPQIEITNATIEQIAMGAL